MSFNPKGQYLMYGGADRKEVYVQEGELYNAKHQRLAPDLNHLNRNRYAMNAELRVKVVQQRAAKEFHTKLSKLQAEQAEFERQMLAMHESELTEQTRELEESLLPAIPPHPSTPQVAPIVLTEIERRLLGATDSGESPQARGKVEDIPLDLEDDIDLGMDLEFDGPEVELDPEPVKGEINNLNNFDPVVKSTKTVAIPRKVKKAK